MGPACWIAPSVVAALAAGLLVATPTVASATSITRSPAAPAAKPAPVASRPDLVSAAVSARAQGSRVEVESLRDELTTTWANPDGTLTTEAHVAPIRYRNAQGRWRDVDLDLAALADGTVGAKSHPKGLNLAGASAAAGKGTASASESDLGQIDESQGKAKRSVVLGWAGRLPAPTIAGTTATYPEVSPGIDVVVSARRTGGSSRTL